MAPPGAVMSTPPATPVRCPPMTCVVVAISPSFPTYFSPTARELSLVAMQVHAFAYAIRGMPIGLHPSIRLTTTSFPAASTTVTVTGLNPR
eukprot:CAMPEP_0206318552 /NCGR_PEP_ID=MMETSP0106_2-20121207/17253_1 /ASSEMBLY_ACC=CAM_ASM_000206 /TAXON_ID=81532 /ORGANISM="Acanthoeca-like sp., Strain 10tr" /LENGTH=90 /DNA_ID=CAMNT_0053750265 /DNA_START=26 /DNA_END=294 /DNA_ORIENTATION=+